MRITYYILETEKKSRRKKEKTDCTIGYSLRTYIYQLTIYKHRIIENFNIYI